MESYGRLARQCLFTVVATACAMTSMSQQLEVNAASAPAFQVLQTDYESRLLAAAAKSDLRGVDFLTREAPAIAQETFGRNWALVRTEALRRLQLLPVYDSRVLDQQPWAAKYTQPFEVLPVQPPPRYLAAGKLWDPTTAILAAVMTVLTQHLSREEMSHSVLIASNIGLHAYRAAWLDKPAFVAEYGHWLIAIDYEMTPEGMFVPLQAAIARMTR